MKTQPLQNSLFISHIDLDGWSSTAIYLYYRDLFFPDSEYINVDYKDFETENNTFDWSLLELPYETIVWCDITPSPKAREIMASRGVDCIIIDHHEGIWGEINSWDYEKKTYIYDKTKSGTLLLTNYLHDNGVVINSVVREYVELVSVYDLFQRESPLWEKASDLNRLFWGSLFYQKEGFDKYKFFIEGQIYKFNNFNTFNFTRVELSKITSDRRKEDDAFNEILRGKNPIKTRKDSLGNYFCVIKLTTKVSALASRILDTWKKLSYVVIINEYLKNEPKISIRSRKGFNLLEKFEGVAGHQEACGLKGVSKEWIETFWSGRDEKIFVLEEKKKVD